MRVFLFLVAICISYAAGIVGGYRMADPEAPVLVETEVTTTDAGDLGIRPGEAERVSAARVACASRYDERPRECEALLRDPSVGNASTVLFFFD